MRETPDIRRTIPAGAKVHYWATPDGWHLRSFAWPAETATPRGSILFQGGRGDIFEKYLELFHHWHEQGWTITSFDWRGQAGSGRLTARANCGDIDSFDTFIDDLRAFYADWEAATPGPHVVMGHSMGGHLVLRGLVEGAIRPDAAVIVAPMLGVKSALGPFAERAARILGGVGDSTRPAWKSNEKPYTTETRANLLTGDPDRYSDEIWWQQHDPAIVTGPPSWRWLIQAFKSMRELANNPRLRKMPVPVLALVAKADGLVDAKAALKIVPKLPDARIVTFGKESAHEILREEDKVRNRAIGEIDLFLAARAQRRLMTWDVAIIGAGIAGASLAAELAPHARVLLLEAEERAGYHSTGRSAAFWSESYGGPAIQPLTTASGAALRPYMEPMGSIHIGRADEAGEIDAFLAEFDGTGVELRAVDPRALIPGLRPEWTLGVLEPSCEYIDVGGLHGDMLAAAKRAGTELRTDAALLSARREHGAWQLETRAGAFEAAVLVNAAGAWADPVAELTGARPLGIQPYRRTIMQLKTDPAPPLGSPMIAHIGGSFYWKPEAGGRIWLSPHDEIETPPCDAQPEDIDIATAIDRFEHAVDWRVEKLEHKWAGLRSFAPDRLPVYGFDPAVPGLFWCAGQGGFGIQTAPAAAQLAAALLLGTAPDPAVAGIDAARYAPERFNQG